MRTATFTVTGYTGIGQLVSSVVYPNVSSYAVDVANKLLTLNFVGGEPSISFDLSTIDVFSIFINEGNQSVNVNSAYNEKVLADGPAHYWELNETSGTTADDLVDGLDGTISGGVTLGQEGATNDGGTSMLFDGNDGTIDMPATTIEGPLTLECWFKSTANEDFLMPISFSAPGDNDNWCQIYLTTDPFEIEPRQGTFLTIDYAIGESINNGFEFANFTDFIAGEWYHIVVVLTFGLLQVYINGVDYGFVTQNDPLPFIPFTSMTQEFHIGSDDGEGFFWNGNVDDVAIYNYALNAAEVLNHYNAKRVS
jgi:hypothetical protein